MSIGSQWSHLRQLLAGGPKAAWFRQVVRPRILDSKPVTETVDGRVEVHVLTSQREWLDLMWGLKSFYRMSGRRYRLCLHDDGSLDDEALGALTTHFPHARIVSRTDADKHMDTVLGEFPLTRAFRQANALSLKVTDFSAYLRGERMLLFDSDSLFFAEPVALLDRLESDRFTINAFNADVASAYVIEPADALAQFGIRLLPLVNSGLGVVQQDLVRYDWVEEFLGFEPVRTGHFWRIEKTLFALSASRYGAQLLPGEYALRLERGIDGRPFRHYAGGIRQLLYKEGLPALVAAGLLRAA
jgi:hypothetical protein